MDQLRQVTQPLEIDYPSAGEIVAFAQAHRLAPQDVVRDIARLIAVHQMVVNKHFLNDDCVLCGGMGLRLRGSPRFTMMDTDISYRLDDFEEAIDLQGVLRIAVEDLSIDADRREEWQERRELTIAQPVRFEESFVNLAWTPDTAKFTVTVARRGLMEPAEWLPLRHGYSPLGIEDISVPVMGINEQAAEKIVAWCANGLAKHYLDVAWIFLRKRGELDTDALRELLRRKLELAARREPDNYANLRTVDQLFPGLYRGDGYRAPQNPASRRHERGIRYVGAHLDMQRAREIVREHAIPFIYGDRTPKPGPQSSPSG
jgi:hypothetical protein